jgi:hypothetical protein
MPPMPSSSSKAVRVQASGVAYEELPVPGAPVRERMAEAPTLMGVAGVNASPRVGGSCVNEEEPQSVDAPGLAVLTLRSLEPSFSSSREAALDDVPSVPRSFDIVDLGNRELGLPGYPRAPPLSASWGQVVGGTELTCSRVASVC